MNALENAVYAGGKANFEQWPEEVAASVVKAYAHTVTTVLANFVTGSGEGSVNMGIGTHSVSTTKKGDSSVVTTSFKSNKELLESITNKFNINIELVTSDEYGNDVIDAFKDEVSKATQYLSFDGECGLYLVDDEALSVLNIINSSILNIANEATDRKGKIVEIDFSSKQNYDHGVYKFTMGEDEMTLTFTPSKEFKQAVKNDSAANDE